MLGAAVASLLLAAPATPADLRPATLWEAWPARRVVTTPAPCLRPAALAAAVRGLAGRHGDSLRVETAGRSVEGRPVPLLTLGRGPRRVMLWSQMHGDEPSATPALLDVVDTLLSGPPGAGAILDRLTLVVVPMLNPDGAERHSRRNAQGIDVNRDALVLATPEGRLLKALRERFAPEIGFNLHDQDRRTTVGDSGVLSSISLLAVSGDPEGTLTPGRARAKRVASLIARTVEPFVPGGVARYDEDWNPRAFGDNLTAWGTPVVLVESGGIPPGRPLTDLTRLNYVALLVALDALASDDAAGEDPALYDGLRRNADRLFVDVLLAGGRVVQPSAPEPYPADVGFDLLDDDAAAAGCPGGAAVGPSRVREVGDGRLLAAGRRVDAAGRLLLPALAVSVRESPRPWLDGFALDALARLGVGRVRWHVPPERRAAAIASAVAAAGPGRPTVQVVDAAARACALVARSRPSPSAATSLSATLDALTARGWRALPASSSLGGLARALACVDPGDPAPAPLVVPDARASLILLRPSAEGALEPERLEVEAVLVDGRPPAPSR
jgi:hypothetical protein